jgi:hypothetical protein
MKEEYVASIIMKKRTLIFYHEDGGSLFVRNISKLLPDYALSHPFIVTIVRL